MNKRTHAKALSIAIAMTALVAAPAFAQDAPPAQSPPMDQSTMPMAPTMSDAQGTFVHLDADHDATISRGEATGDAQLSAAFDSLDVDGNGSLSATEYGKYAQDAHTDMTDDSTTNDNSGTPVPGSN